MKRLLFCAAIAGLILGYLVLLGCSSAKVIKEARQQAYAEILNNVSEPDCWIGFYMGTTVGDTESLQDKSLREAMMGSVIQPNPIYTRCFKWGLVYESQGKKALEVVKKGISTAIMLAK